MVDGWQSGDLSDRNAHPCGSGCLKRDTARTLLDCTGKPCPRVLRSPWVTGAPSACRVRWHGSAGGCLAPSTLQREPSLLLVILGGIAS
jgi:hypothetical protein